MDENKYKKFVNKILYELDLDKNTLDDDIKYYLNPQLATIIQKQFNDKYFEDDSFENIVFTSDEVRLILNNNYDPFKFYIAKQTKDLTIADEKTRNECKEIQYLMKNQNKIAGIITTNYDLLLESIFPDFDVLVGQDNMLTANTNNIFEIFKIHGSADKADSIVITQGDYNYFEKKLKYLSAKLLTLFVEHPIIFIGYNVGDLNIRNILKEISQCLNKKQLEEIKSNFIFVSPAFGQKETIQEKEIEFGNKRIIMTEITIEDFSVLYNALSIIKSSMPIKVVRKLQDMICNFIATTESTNNIIVNINNSNLDGEQLGIYFGDISTVSTMGFDYYGIDDIIEDILFDNKPFLMNNKLLDKTFKNIRSIAGMTYLPVYKYLNGLNVKIEALPKEWHIIRSVSNMELNRSEKKFTKNKEKYKYSSIKEIELDHPGHLLKQLAYIQLNVESIPIEELGEYLRIKQNDKEFKQKAYAIMKILVAIYDYYKYGNLKIKKV